MAATGRTDVTRSAVLAHLGAQGPTSRADLARALAVSPALITQITRQLLDDALITELTHSPSQGGRPARLLGLAADAGHAIGVKVVSDHVAIVEAGIDGAVVRSATEPFEAAGEAVLPRLAELLRAFIASGGEHTLLGIGIGVPGSVEDLAVGTVDSTLLGWRGMPVGEVLRHDLGLPVLVENNVNALAMAEALHGKARGHDDALVVTIGAGVGSGIIADGAVLRGRAGGAGELGHVPVDEAGPRCQCGAHGCLEAFIGRAGLIEQARTEGLVEGDDIDGLRQAADRGDTAAQALFSRAGHLLGRALAGAVNMLDPEIVILLGEGLDAWPHWSYGFEPAFRAGLMPRNRGIAVSIETWQDDRWAQGAAALILATPFDAQGRAGEQGRLVRERLATTPPIDGGIPQ